MKGTFKKVPEDAEMHEEEKEKPKAHHRPSLDDASELLKSELEDYDKSELSEYGGFDPFFGRTLSLDAMRGFANIPQRIGRSESIEDLMNFSKSDRSCQSSSIPIRSGTFAESVRPLVSY